MLASIARFLLLPLALSPLFAQRQIVPGHAVRGGEVVVAAASDPQTFNPVFASDSASQLISSLTMADLMHINARTLAVEPALALRVVHRSARVWRVLLRQGVRFSDGAPFTSQDVAFSFAVYTDPKLDAPERQLLTINGAPIRCRIISPSEVELDLPGPLAVGDRVFDSVWMLPRHLLEAPYRAGKLEQAWGPGTAPAAIAGLGPFRLAAFQPGREIALERNPNYWRADAAGAVLPYLDRLRLQVVSDANLRLTLFARGQLDGLDAVSSSDFDRLRGNPCCHMLDAGPGLNSETLVLNFNAHPWFASTVFRQAVSEAIDRANLVRNVFQGRAAPLASLTSPSAGVWADPTPATPFNAPAAAALLADAGFRLRSGQLYDASGRAVAFSLLVPASNEARMKMAVFLQEDLRRVGITVTVTPLDFASYLDRLLHKGDFEAALLGIQIPDADPNEESNEWPLGATLHLWRRQAQAAAPWEGELDQWFRQQLASPNPAQRLRLYRRIQAIEHTQLPFIPLVAPDILVAAKPNLGGLQPGLLPPHLLWNSERLYWLRP